MISIILIQFPTQIILNDEITHVGIPINFNDNGKPTNTDSSFWIRYINKKGEDYELIFEVKKVKVSDGIKLDLQCEVNQTANNNFEKIRDFTIHLDQTTDSYAFKELE